MATCPYCSETISDLATVCPFCGSILTGEPYQATAGPGGGPGGTPPTAPGSVGAGPTPPGAVIGEGAVRFTHSGHRYVLGFGTDFFGIWDRQQAGGPVQRFPRTDEGWSAAWVAFEDLEPDNVAVGPPAPPPPSAEGSGWSVPSTAPWPPAAAPEASRRVSPAWWLLPILFSLIGGLVAWALTRGRDPRMARFLLLGGAVMFLVNLYLVNSGVLHLGR